MNDPPFGFFIKLSLSKSSAKCLAVYITISNKIDKLGIKDYFYALKIESSTMKVLIFNGSLDEEAFRTSRRIAQYYADRFSASNIEVQQVHLSDYEIPIFHPRATEPTPQSVLDFVEAFTTSDIQVWLTPLYHGGMAGVMKNALDWLELTAQNNPAYLTNKVVGLGCWSGGHQAMQGIQAMDNVARALRAWTLPYQIPMNSSDIYDNNEIADFYKTKFNLMVELLLESQKL